LKSPDQNDLFGRLSGHVKNIISNYVSILFEEDAMEAIRVGCFVGFHGVKGGKHFIFGDRFGERKFLYVINGGWCAFMESVGGGMLMTTKEIFEVFLSCFLEDRAIRGPYAIWKLKPMDSISLSSDDSLGMKERGIFVTKFNPVLP